MFKYIMERNVEFNSLLDVCEFNFIYVFKNFNVNCSMEGYAHIIEHIIVRIIKKNFLENSRDFISCYGYTEYDHINITVKFIFNQKNLEIIHKTLKSIDGYLFSSIDYDIVKNELIEEYFKYEDDSIKKLQIIKKITNNKYLFLPMGKKSILTDTDIKKVRSMFRYLYDNSYKYIIIFSNKEKYLKKYLNSIGCIEYKVNDNKEIGISLKKKNILSNK